MAMKRYSSMDEYLSDFNKSTQEKLQKVMHTIHKSAPGTDLTFSYGIPTYKKDGHTVIHFAAYKSHIGLYPGPRTIEACKADLKDYKTSKGTVQFQLDKPIPYDLIAKMTELAMELNLEKKK